MRADKRPNRIATMAGKPSEVSASPVTTPAKASVDPTERSNPPEINRMTMPTAMVPSTDSPNRIASIFALERNTSETMVIIIAKMTSTAINENSLAEAKERREADIDDRFSMLSLSWQPEIES
jgi:hypothetical protein